MDIISPRDKGCHTSVVLAFCTLFFIQLCQAEPLSVGVEITDYSPYYFLNQGDYDGEARVLLDAFAAEQDLDLSYQPLPVPRLFLLFTRDQLDLKFPDNPLWSPTLKSGLTVHYSDPVFDITEAVMTLASNNEPVKTVGTIQGFTAPGISYQVTQGNLLMVEASTMEQLMLMLQSGRIDALYFNTRVAFNHAAHRTPALDLKVREEFHPYHYGYHLSSLRHPQLIEAFNLFLKRYHEGQVSDSQ